jgi:hypothetical protein
MTLTSPPTLIHGIGNIDITSTSGTINHNSETAFLHNNDSFLQDIKGLKATIANGAVLGYNGTNIYAIPDGTFATQAQQSVDEWSIALLQNQVADIQANFLRTADQVVKNVTTDSHLVLSGGSLSLNLSEYLTSDQIASNYTTATMGSNLDTRVSALENDHVTESQFNDLSTTVAGMTPYISSVGSNLNVSAGNLTVDLSALAPRDGASFSGLTTVQALAYAITGDAVCFDKSYYISKTEINQSGSVQTFDCAFGRQQHFDIKAYFSGAVNGKIELTKIFRGGGFSPMSEVSEATSLSIYGTVTGNEIDVINISENSGQAQQITFNIPAFTSMVVKLTFCEQPSNV